MTRIEEWVLGIAQALGLDFTPDIVVPAEPVWHFEEMLAAIYDVASGAASPRPFPARCWHLDEFLYAVYKAVAGDNSVTPPVPTNRIEMCWASIYGALVGDSSTYYYDYLDAGNQWRDEELLNALYEAAEGGNWIPATYKKLKGLTYNNNAFYEITDFKMNGDDTLRFSFKCTMSSPACNVLGAYDGSSASTNYSLYLGASSSAKYLRYDGSTYRSDADQDVQYDVVITPTGVTGLKADSTWTEKTFTSTNNLCIGTTSPSATSSKMVGDIPGRIVVDGRLELVPVERVSDHKLGYFDLYSRTFYEPTGSGIESMGYA